MIDFITVRVGHVVNEVESLHLRMLYIIMYLNWGSVSLSVQFGVNFPLALVYLYDNIYNANKQKIQ